MKNKLFAVLMAVLFMTSCSIVDVLNHYEDGLSLTDEEFYELVQGKWIINKVGYWTTLDEYGVEQIDQDNDYPVPVSAMKSLEIDRTTIKFNFTHQVPVTYTWWDTEAETRREKTVLHDSFVSKYSRPGSKSELNFGLEADGTEYFWCHHNSELEDGYSGYMIIDLYGIEKMNGDVIVKRMIIRSGDYGCYEFVKSEK